MSLIIENTFAIVTMYHIDELPKLCAFYLCMDNTHMQSYALREELSLSLTSRESHAIRSQGKRCWRRLLRSLRQHLFPCERGEATRA